jgi:hypothetical protein
VIRTTWSGILTGCSIAVAITLVFLADPARRIVLNVASLVMGATLAVFLRCPGLVDGVLSLRAAP